MPLTTITFFPANRDAALSDIELKAALETVKAIAPPGSRCEVRALDDTFMEIKVPPGGPPDYTFEDSGVLPKPFAPAAATIWSSTPTATPRSMTAADSATPKWCASATTTPTTCSSVCAA